MNIVNNINQNTNYIAFGINNKNKNNNEQKVLLQETDLNLLSTSELGKTCVVDRTKETKQFIREFLSEKDIEKSTKMLLERYPELSWLTGSVNATPEGNNTNKSSSISETLFGEKHIEFDRTIVGIECLKSVLNDNYEAFTKCQKDAVRLSKEEFKKLRDFTTGVLQTAQDVDAMIAYTVINDLGKIKSFTKHVEEITGIKTNDHDEALLIGLKTMPEEIPSFNRLSTTYKNDVLNALNTGFNLAQFVQCECLEGNLQGLKDMNPKARDLYLVHVFYDVAGAAGHVNPNGSLVMTSPVYTGYMQGIEAISNVSNTSEFDVYNDFLAQKADTLSMKLDTKEDKALLKLAVMSRASNEQDVNNIIEAYNNLPEEEQKDLTTGLNSNGITDCGILLYYSPAFLQNSMNANPQNKVGMLAKAFKVMSYIYKDNKENEETGIKTISLSNIANRIKEEPEISAEDLYNYFCNNQ